MVMKIINYIVSVPTARSFTKIGDLIAHLKTYDTGQMVKITLLFDSPRGRFYLPVDVSVEFTQDVEESLLYDLFFKAGEEWYSNH